MATPTKKRPTPFAVGRVRVRVHSGPREDGRWRWRADRQAGPTREHVWLGWGTRDEAEAAVIQVLAQVGDPQADLQAVSTVHDLLDCWVRSQEDRSDVSAFTRSACRLAAARLSGVIGDVRVDRVDRRVLERYRDRSGDAGATVARGLKYLRQAWRWGRELGVVPAVDLPSVRVARQDPVRTRYTPTRAEVASILGRVSPLVRMALVLLSTTGARVSEITTLRWRTVTPDCGSIRVDGKTGPRDVALHPSVSRELARWGEGRRRDDALVVEVSPQQIGRVLAQHSPAHGRISPNGLRRHVVDVLYGSAGPDVAAQQLGHSAHTAMAIYRQVTEGDRRKAVVRAGLGVPDEPGTVHELHAKKNRGKG